VNAFAARRVSLRRDPAISPHDEALQPISPSDYLFPALAVGIIMSGGCPACFMGWRDQALGATE